MRFKKTLFILSAVFAFVLAGCQNGLMGRVADDGNAESTVTFSVSDIPTDWARMIEQAKNPASRTIMPSAHFPLNHSDLTFILSGRSNTGRELPKTGSQAIKPALTHGTSNSTFTQLLGAGVWDLTLTAYKGYSDGASVFMPVLQGHCTVDISNSNGTATFKMSTDGLTTPGTVKVSGNVKDDLGKCSHYEIGIYNAYSGALIEKYTDNDGTEKTIHTDCKYDITHPTAGTFPFTYETETVSPNGKITLNAGAYDFRMVFFRTGVGTEPPFVPIGSYIEELVVFPGKDLDYAITPNPLDVLQKAPTAPEDFRAYLVNNSEDKEPGYYYTKLTWKRAKYETNYELKLKTSSDDGTTFSPADEKIYGFKSTDTNADDFLASGIWHEGNLAYGSESCTLKLMMGKVYEVELRAHNYIGDSAWVERNTAAPASPPAGLTFFDFNSTPTEKKHINRMRASYNLNGGELSLAGSAPPAITGVYTVYESYTGTSKTLLSIAPSGTAGNHLVRTGTPPVEFVEWLDASGSPAAPNYTYQNVFVKANFGFGLEGTVTPPVHNELEKTKLDVGYGKLGDAPTLVSESPVGSNHYQVPKRIGPDVMWITVKINAPTEFTNLHCKASFAPGAGLNSVVDIPCDSTGVCKFSTGPYTPQVFTLLVMAEDIATHQLRSQSYIIDLY